uniref:HAD family hydrolase n=1 Tax=Acetatifactor sp. TaxID=1872090 RepID=UPI004055C89A
MKAVVFDMDGVLFDTEKLCKTSWNMIAREMGITDMEEVFMQCVGRNSNDAKILMTNHYGERLDYDEFRKKASAYFWEVISENGTPMKPGVRELLIFLQEAGYQIGLASSTKRESIIKHLMEVDIFKYFSVIVSGDMVEHSKPNPEIYLLACEKLGVTPQEAYAIEDSPNGIRSAYAAGMKPLMVPDLIAPDAEMEELSFRIFKDLLEVRDFLCK